MIQTGQEDENITPVHIRVKVQILKMIYSHAQVQVHFGKSIMEQFASFQSKNPSKSFFTGHCFHSQSMTI